MRVTGRRKRRRISDRRKNWNDTKVCFLYRLMTFNVWGKFNSAKRCGARSRPDSGQTQTARSSIRKAIRRLDQAMQDAGFAVRVARPFDQVELRLGPGAMQFPGGL